MSPARRTAPLGRALPLDLGPMNGRNRCSPLIDRLSGEGLDFDESTAVDPTRKPAARAIPPSRDTFLMSAFLIFGLHPLGRGAAQPPPGRASSRLTARPARIWQARRLPRCRDSAPCFPASCAREAAARLSDCPFSYIYVPP